ncbi:MAG: hypothetical protein RIR49_1335 [Actinomycetota bacterium]
MTAPYRYSRDERLPIEVLVFAMDPTHVEEFLAVDHEVWTLGEALLPGFERIPFIAKEVWLDGTRPGEVTLVFVWESAEAWRRVADVEIQTRLQAEFDRRFPHPVTLVQAPHDETDEGPVRWSRFERVESLG